VVPSLGTVVGGGTLDSKNELDFKLVAGVTAGVPGAMEGGVGKLLGGGASSCKEGMKVPFQVHGTTSNPQFVPDIGGAAAGLLKSQLGCTGGSLGGLGKGAGGEAENAVKGLGGLLKKPKL